MVSIREAPDSRGFNIDPDAIDFDTKWIVTDALNEVDVQAAVILSTPRIYRRLIRQKMKAEEKVQGSGTWFVTLTYGNIDPNRALGTTPFAPPPPDPNGPLNGINGPKFNFDTTGETAHITQSFDTRSCSDATHAGTLVPDNNKAIGVDRDSIKGCDVIVPKFDFTIEIPFPFVSMAYIIGLYSISGTVNYAQRFAGFEMGELLYRGANGSYSVDDAWTITHHFSAKPNRKDVNLNGALFPTNGVLAQPAGGGTIKIPEVKGWDYVWVEYVLAAVGTRMMQIPKRAFVEIVYPTGDFQIITGGPQALRQKLEGNGIDPSDAGFFGSMSEKIKSVVRHPTPATGLPGTLVEWSWSDPRLPDDIIVRP